MRMVKNIETGEVFTIEQMKEFFTEENAQMPKEITFNQWLAEVTGKNGACELIDTRCRKCGDEFDIDKMFSVNGKFGYCFHCMESMAINALQEEDTILDIEDSEGTEYALCAWCEEIYEVDELNEDEDIGYICDNCVEAIRSRGEKLNLKEQGE